MFWRGRCECVSVDVSVSVVEDWRRGGGREGGSSGSRLL